MHSALFNRPFFGKLNAESVYEFGQALEFDGVDDKCTMGTEFTSENFCIGGWLFLDSNSTFRFISGPSFAHSINLSASGNVLSYRVGATSSNFAFLDIPVGEWFHFLLSANSAGEGRCFINGIESTSGMVTKASGHSGIDYNTIGVRLNPEDGYYDGSMDDIFFCSSTQPDPEAAALAIFNGADPLSVLENVSDLFRLNGDGSNEGSNGDSLTINGPVFFTR